MARRKQDQQADPDGPPSYEDEITETAFLPNVQGRNLKEVLEQAKIMAAEALNTRPENIFIKSNSSLVPDSYARFGNNMKPILWRATVTCGLVPEHLRIG